MSHTPRRPEPAPARIPLGIRALLWFGFVGTLSLTGLLLVLVVLSIVERVAG